MPGGKVIKNGSREYRFVERIDIFTGKTSKLVDNLDLNVVADAPKEVEALFDESMLTIPGESKDSETVDSQDVEELMESYAKDEKEAEPIVETVHIEKDELESLKNELDDMKKQLQQKDDKIAKMKKGFKKEGYDRGYQEGYSKGMVNGSKDIENSIEQMKKDMDEMLSSLKVDTETVWNDIVKLIEQALIKITGQPMGKEVVESILDMIKKTFPDETRLNLRISKDIFTVFNGVEHHGVHITKDTSLEEKSIICEMEEGVADFSISTQIDKIIRWLNGEEDV